jgi:hypothetical protein
MPSIPAARIAVRFPWFADESWRTRCRAALAAATPTPAEIVCLPPGPGTSANASPGPPVDLVVDFSTGPLEPHQLNPLPRLGYWTFVYGPGPELERIDPGLPEFIAGSRAAYVRLVQLTASNSAEVLREGSVKAVGHSLAATRRRLLEAIVDWPARLLKNPQPPLNPLTTVRLRQRGVLARIGLRALLPLAWIRNILTRIAREVTREQWAVGVIDAPVAQVCQSFDPTRIRWLPVPADGFLADPFGLTRADGTVVIMAEALSWREGRGRIVTLEWRADGEVTAPQDVLAFSSHTSYPQLIEHAGAIYCIPETLAQRRVQLFRADPFPNRWVPDTVLLENFAGADATVCRHDGCWWLFVGNHDDQDETKLFVFHATELQGPWRAHAANPVKCDLRSARPAGPLFLVDGILHRPAQDCSRTYGGAVVINRIERLTTEEFVERPVRHLAPAAQGPYPHGLHTLSGAGNVTLVDGKRHVVAPAALMAPVRLAARDLGRRLKRRAARPVRGDESSASLK